MRLIGAVCVVLAAAAPACGGPARRGVEYMPNMVVSVPYDSFAPNPVLRGSMTLQLPVAGTIPRGYLPLHYAPTQAEAQRAGRELVNPIVPTDATIAAGRELYGTFCAVCHGPTGDGDGSIVPKIPNPPAYTSDRVRDMPVGRLFHIVTYGSGRMPSYASQTSAADRWLIVNYVRTLQHGNGRRP
jgi:mono/diheme cytochrome c family protein